MALDVEQLAVRKTVTVEASQERCFEVFTTGFGTWWPLASHHIAAVDAADAVIEPFAGGRWYERGVDGSECEWGRVAAFEPPARLLLIWMLNEEYAYVDDEGLATEVEVRFVAEAPDRTRVELEHRGFEKLGEGGRKMAAGVSADGGWGSLLELYAAEVASRA